MNVPTLEEFIEREGHFMDHSYVSEEGFSSLYVRKGPKYINVNGEMKRFENVFQIANVTADKPGRRAFTKLISKLEKKWLGPIFIESVLAEKFASALLGMGFIPVNMDEDWGGFPHHFVKNIEVYNV
jgi:hypothetical protein